MSAPSPAENGEHAAVVGWPEPEPIDDETAARMLAAYAHKVALDHYCDLPWWRRLVTRRPRRIGTGRGVFTDDRYQP